MQHLTSHLLLDPKKDYVLLIAIPPAKGGIILIYLEAQGEQSKHISTCPSPSPNKQKHSPSPSTAFLTLRFDGLDPVPQLFPHPELFTVLHTFKGWIFFLQVAKWTQHYIVSILVSIGVLSWVTPKILTHHAYQSPTQILLPPTSPAQRFSPWYAWDNGMPSPPGGTLEHHGQ